MCCIAASTRLPGVACGVLASRVAASLAPAAAPSLPTHLHAQTACLLLFQPTASAGNGGVSRSGCKQPGYSALIQSSARVHSNRHVLHACASAHWRWKHIGVPDAKHQPPSIERQACNNQCPYTIQVCMYCTHVAMQKAATASVQQLLAAIAACAVSEQGYCCSFSCCSGCCCCFYVEYVTQMMCCCCCCCRCLTCYKPDVHVRL
jgi:hypothetical protein